MMMMMIMIMMMMMRISAWVWMIGKCAPVISSGRMSKLY